MCAIVSIDRQAVPMTIMSSSLIPAILDWLILAGWDCKAIVRQDEVRSKEEGNRRRRNEEE